MSEWDKLTDLQEFARKNYPDLDGKVIPAGILIAYLFFEHDHDDQGTPVVNSIKLDRFIRDNAPKMKGT